MARIASFHLVREPSRGVVRSMARLGLDRPVLSRTPGLAFWRLMGTGAGARTGPGADLRRRVLFAVWEDEADLDRFLDAAPVAARWRDAAETWHVRLRLISGHGRWNGIDPLDGIERGDGAGPIAVLTRADVRLRAWPAFRRASRAVDEELRDADGLVDTLAIGEAPVGRLGTFSLWESADAVTAFAAEMPRHRAVIAETRHADWYREELFARFEPLASAGSWDGRDPLGEMGGRDARRRR